VDPDLLRQLTEAESRGGAGVAEVQAVFMLEPGQGSGADPQKVEARVQRVVRRVERTTGERPATVHVFRNLDAFVVQASPGFLRGLLDQPEIRHARANRPSRDA
jgi:hypothetical protein